MQTCLQVEGQIESLLAHQQQLLAKKEQLEQHLSADRRAPRADWKGSFSWDVDVQHTAETTFGITSFRCFTQPSKAWQGLKLPLRPREETPTVAGTI